MKNEQGKIVTFGELMLRFSKPDKQRLSQGKLFWGNYGGSEANVAVSLAMQGEHVEYVTRLPDTQMGHAGAMKLRELGVATDHVLYGGDRIGTYYFEEAASLRNSSVNYDRAGSAYYYLCPGMIDWREVLQGASVLHVSGITAAITQSACDATFEALDTAQAMGLTISIDLNYRRNLWKYDGARPREVLERMMGYADVMFGDVIEYDFITQHEKIPFRPFSVDYDMNLDAYREWYEQHIKPRSPRCQKLMIGLRHELSSSHHMLTAFLFADGQMYHTRIAEIPEVVDPMGVGDAFAGGFLHALRLFPCENQQILDYSLAAAALKSTISGDFNLSTEEEILQLGKMQKIEGSGK